METFFFFWTDGVALPATEPRYRAPGLSSTVWVWQTDLQRLVHDSSLDVETFLAIACKQWFLEGPTSSICLEGFHYPTLHRYHERPPCSSLDASEDRMTLYHSSSVVHPSTELGFINLDDTTGPTDLLLVVDKNFSEEGIPVNQGLQGYPYVCHNESLPGWISMKRDLNKIHILTKSGACMIEECNSHRRLEDFRLATI